MANDNKYLVVLSFILSRDFQFAVINVILPEGYAVFNFHGVKIIKTRRLGILTEVW